jgi:hypothetical protein
MNIRSKTKGEESFNKLTQIKENIDEIVQKLKEKPKHSQCLMFTVFCAMTMSMLGPYYMFHFP